MNIGNLAANNRPTVGQVGSVVDNTAAAVNIGNLNNRRAMGQVGSVVNTAVCCEHGKPSC